MASAAFPALAPARDLLKGLRAAGPQNHRRSAAGNSRAAARPIPLEAPVITTTLSLIALGMEDPSPSALRIHYSVVRRVRQGTSGAMAPGRGAVTAGGRMDADAVRPRQELVDQSQDVRGPTGE